jgi:hypothetical protein
MTCVPLAVVFGAAVAICDAERVSYVVEGADVLTQLGRVGAIYRIPLVLGRRGTGTWVLLTGSVFRQRLIFPATSGCEFWKMVGVLYVLLLADMSGRIMPES